MPSIQYVHLAAAPGGENNATSDSTAVVVAAVYSKIKSTRRTYEDNTVEVFWEGILVDPGRVGSATFVQMSNNNNGGFGGTFTTEEAGYTLLQRTDGAFHLRALSWSQVNETDPDDETDKNNNDSKDDDTNKDGSSKNPIPDKITVEKVVSFQKTKKEEISEGPAADTIPGRRRLIMTPQQQQHRHLQSISTVDVLVLITNRAMCEATGLSFGCANNELNRVALNVVLAIAQNNVIQSMNNGFIPIKIRFISTQYLSASDGDKYTNAASLTWITSSRSVQDLRKKNGADLVTVIGSVDPATGACGTSLINGHASVVSWTCFSIFSLTHEM
jgi:hypothetical protein